jgi:cell wall-associated NlpC family hydrolase
MDGLAQVHARIAEIQALFPPPVRQAPAVADDWISAAAAAGLTATSSTTAGQGLRLAESVATADLAGTGASAAGAAVVEKARQFLGVPYLWGGTDPSKGLDCSGFTQLVYKSQGIDLPRVSSQQATAGRAVGSLAEAAPGDLLFFDYSPSRPGIDHVGIYVGDGKMIAAPQPGDVVKIQSVGQPAAIRRVLPDGSA